MDAMGSVPLNVWSALVIMFWTRVESALSSNVALASLNPSMNVKTASLIVRSVTAL